MKTRPLIPPRLILLTMTLAYGACSSTAERDASVADTGNADSGTMADVGNSGSDAGVSTNYRTSPCIDHVGEVADGMECGFITVVQNRVRDTGRNLELFFVRPASPPAGDQPPVVVLAGGPGTAHGPFAALRELPIQMSQLLGREVIYVDQRGIPPSLPSTACPELDTAQDSAAAFATCRARLEADSVDVHSFNTLENAADIAAIPEALGVPQIDLIAGSYATQLGARVLSRHPDAIRAAVFGGVAVPGAPDDGWYTPAFGMVLDAAASDYAARCAADTACSALHPGFDLETIAGQIQMLIQRDGSVEILGQPINNIQQVVQLAFPMMYIAQVRNMFFGALYHAANESTPAYMAHIGEGDAAAGAQFLGQLLATAQRAVFGGESVMSTVTRCYDGEQGSCDDIGDRIDDYPASDFLEPSGSTHPVLFVSGVHDPTTPISNMPGYLPLWDNGRQSVFSCLGHDISRISNLANGTCVAEQARAFLDDPTADLPDCAAALCDGLPLIPARTELTRQLRDYVVDFDG